MAETKQIIVTFPEPIADQLMAAVEAGEYATTSEAICDAVRAWNDRRQQDIERLRRAWDEGKASGSAGPLNMAEIIAEAKAERARRAGPKRG
jgi:antitoxin ParD1/3/4